MRTIHARLVFAITLGPALFAATDPQLQRFQARMYEDAHGKMSPYRLFVPNGYDPGTKYPLIVWLHGLDAVGTDNALQISGQNYTGPNIWTEREIQDKYHPFVLAPQIPKGAVWATPLTRAATAEAIRVLDIIAAVKKEFPIDSDRIYLLGQSLGGYGVWALAAQRPDMFAAAVPICGGGNPTRGESLAKVPIWAFHSKDDLTVPVVETRLMVDAARKAGGVVRYTEFPNGRHNAWDRAVRDPDLQEWLFSKKRKSD